MKGKAFTCACGLLACLMLFCALPVSSVAAGGADQAVTAEQVEAFVREAERECGYWDGKKPDWATSNWCAYFLRRCLSVSGIGDFSSNGAGDLAREIGKNCASAVYYTASAADAALCDRYQQVNMDAYIPLRGDIVVYKLQDGNVGGMHTGVVTAYDPATNAVTTVEGNTTSRGIIRERTVTLRTSLSGIGRIAAYVRFEVAASSTALRLGPGVSLSDDEMHAIEALTAFFYGSCYWDWKPPEPFYFEFIGGLQALFFYESDLIGATAERDIEDGYLWGLTITQENLGRFVKSITGFDMPAPAPEDCEDQDEALGIFYTGGVYEFLLTDYNMVPYIVSVDAEGTDVLLVRATMINQLGSGEPPTEEELNAHWRYEMCLRRDANSPYGFVLEWRPQPD